MLILGVVIKIKALLLKALSADVANVAFILLVCQQLISLFSERCEGIKHESTYDISKQHFEESEIDNIVDKTQDLERLHGLAYGPADVELDHAAEDIITHIVNLIRDSIDVYHVVAEGHCTEDESKGNTHHTHQQQRTAAHYHTV